MASAESPAESLQRFDERTATCRLFTEKEGLLSAVAHDLELSVTRFSIEREGDKTVRARFDARSLRVLHALRSGVAAPSLLSAGDLRKIEENIVNDVLDARRFPEILLVSRRVERAGEGFVMEGDLTLHGKTRSVRINVVRSGGELVAKHVISQPDYGIRPYSAMLGALRIKPDVRVVIRVPADSKSS